MEASKQRCTALQNSNRGLSSQLSSLQGVARALARDYKAHKAQSRTQLAELGQSIVTQYKPLLVGKLKVSFFPMNTQRFHGVPVGFGSTSEVYCSFRKFITTVLNHQCYLQL